LRGVYTPDLARLRSIFGLVQQAGETYDDMIRSTVAEQVDAFRHRRETVEGAMCGLLAKLGLRL
jgi:hypothetical protein